MNCAENNWCHLSPQKNYWLLPTYTPGKFKPLAVGCLLETVSGDVMQLAAHLEKAKWDPAASGTVGSA